jgi:hypothetical protein
MQDAYEPPFDRYATPVDGDEAAPCVKARLARVEATLDRMEATMARLERTMRRWMIVLMVWSAAWMTLMVYVTRGCREGAWPAKQ